MKFITRCASRGLFLLCLITSICNCVRAQINVTHKLENARVSDDGLAYEVDVMISTTTPFKFGSGQLYFNYDVQAFGQNVERNNNVEVLTANSILGTVAGFPVYQTPVINDNTTSRVSVAYLQGTSSGCLSGPNVTSTPSLLFTLRLLYAPGQSGSLPTVCLEDQDLFANQTFTACGPDTGCAFADCQGDPGTQITEDYFICAAALPVDLLAFTARRIKDDAHLQWATAREENSLFYGVEKSRDGRDWRAIGRVEAAGNSTIESVYYFEDNNFLEGTSTVYYRLRMEDTDGSFTYSPIRQLTTEMHKNEMWVYPNPVTDQLYVRLAEVPDHNLKLRLFSPTGKLIFQKTIPAGSSEVQNLNLAAMGLSSGVYSLQSSAGISQRIVYAR